MKGLDVMRATDDILNTIARHDRTILRQEACRLKQRGGEAWAIGEMVEKACTLFDEAVAAKLRERSPRPPPPPPDCKVNFGKGWQDPGVPASAGFTSKSFKFLRCRHGARWHRATLLLCPLSWPVLAFVGAMVLIVKLLEEVFERKE